MKVQSRYTFSSGRKCICLPPDKKLCVDITIDYRGGLCMVFTHDLYGEWAWSFAYHMSLPYAYQIFQCKKN